MHPVALLTSGVEKVAPGKEGDVLVEIFDDRTPLIKNEKFAVIVQTNCRVINH